MQVVSFRVCAESVAFPVESVREVITPNHISLVFNAPPFVEGLTNVRGEAVPVFNLARLFGFHSPQYCHELVVIVENGPLVAGILARRPVDIIDLPEGSEPQSLDGTPCLEAVSQVLMVDGGIVVVLAPERLFDLPVVKALREEEIPLAL